jgi:hypothetical protein
VSLLEGIRIALGSLIANPLRSFLTLLGIIIGITAIVTGHLGDQRPQPLYVADKLSNQGPGVFVITRFGLISNHEDFLKAARRNKRLRLADANELRERSELAAAVGSEVHSRDNLTLRGETIKNVDIGGITPRSCRSSPTRWTADASSPPPRSSTRCPWPSSGRTWRSGSSPRWTRWAPDPRRQSQHRPSWASPRSAARSSASRATTS